MAVDLLSLLSKQMELSFTPPQNFYMVIDKLPEIMYTVQRIQLPVLSAEEQLQSTPMNPGKTFIPGEGLEYSVLSCDFLIDKYFKNYRSILQWLKQNTRPENQSSQSVGFGDTLSNITVVGTDAANTPLVHWHFVDAFPISLDGPLYDSTMPDIEYLPSNVTFRYKYFKFGSYNNGTFNHDEL